MSELVARWLLEEGAEPSHLAPPPPAAAAAAAPEAPPEDATEAAAAPAPAQEEQAAAAEWGREAAEPDSEEGRCRQRIQGQ